MEQRRVNLLPDSETDNDLVQVNDSCVFKYEFENDINNKCPQQPNPKGNLRKNIAFWKEIGTSQFILNIIAEGYRLTVIFHNQSYLQISPRKSITNLQQKRLQNY